MLWYLIKLRIEGIRERWYGKWSIVVIYFKIEIIFLGFSLGRFGRYKDMIWKGGLEFYFIYFVVLKFCFLFIFMCLGVFFLVK